MVGVICRYNLFNNNTLHFRNEKLDRARYLLVALWVCFTFNGGDLPVVHLRSESVRRVEVWGGVGA